MSPYMENAQPENNNTVSARLLEHPYYEVVLEWCQEKGINIQGFVETRKDVLLVTLPFEDDKQNVFSTFFRLYEAESIYFWVATEVGVLELETKQNAINELSEMCLGSRTMLRLGLDYKDRVLISFRGEASILNRETFKKHLVEILENAMGLREILLSSGIKFQTENSKELAK